MKEKEITSVIEASRFDQGGSVFRLQFGGRVAKTDSSCRPLNIELPRKVLVMPLTAADVSLNTKDQATIDRVRPLYDYRLSFINGRYPLLSFIYAIYAGGESTLYCDHSLDYLNAYLVESASPADHAQAKIKAAGIKEILARVATEREVEREKDPRDQVIPRLNSNDWDRLLVILKQELEQPDPVPPPPPKW